MDIIISLFLIVFGVGVISGGCNKDNVDKNTYCDINKIKDCTPLSESIMTGYILKVSRMPELPDFLILQVNSQKMLLRKSENEMDVETLVGIYIRYKIRYKIYNFFDGKTTVKLPYITSIQPWASI